MWPFWPGLLMLKRTRMTIKSKWTPTITWPLIISSSSDLQKGAFCKSTILKISKIAILSILRVGTDSGDHFTAEARDKDNEVKGVYSWIDPRGESHTVTYTSGKHGYKTLPLKKSGLDLPPFPYSLYGTPPKEQIQPRVLDEGPKLYRSPKGPNQSDQPSMTKSIIV